jgi:hypothetical protein
MMAVDILWICVMAGPRKAAIECASSMLEHWERRLDFYQLYVALRLQAGTEKCARWQSFLIRVEAKLAALRMRRDVLVSLEEARKLDTLPVDGCQPVPSVDPGAAERFAETVAEIERRLALVPQANSP